MLARRHVVRNRLVTPTALAVVGVVVLTRATHGYSFERICAS